MLFDTHFMQYTVTGAAGAVALASALERNRSITTLDLRVRGGRGEERGDVKDIVV